VRYRLRQDIKVITFTGAQSKREVLLAMEDGAVVTDKRGRVGRWNAIHTSALKDKIVKALIA
jgi:hypothetical protein